MKISAIYKISSKVHAERIYIGSAIHYRERWTKHLRCLRNNNHENNKLQNHYNKYGNLDLIFSIIEPCLPEFLLIREQYYIDTLNPYFNICKIAGSTLGVKRSIESRKRQGEIYRGKNHPMYGRHHTEQSIKLMSEGRKGCKAWNKGIKMSEEIRERSRESHKGIRPSELTRKK